MITPPYRPSLATILTKTGLGMVVGLILSFVLFLMVSLLGASFFAPGNTMVLAIGSTVSIGISMMIGTLLLILLYTFVYPDEYYDFFGYAGIVIIIHLMMIVGAMPVMMAMKTAYTIVIAMGYIGLCTLFVSYTVIESLDRLHYMPAHYIGTFIGFLMSCTIYTWIYSLMGDSADSFGFIMIIPYLIGYTVMPFVHSVWSSLYAGLVSLGANPLSATLRRDDEVLEERVNIQL